MTATETIKPIAVPIVVIKSETAKPASETNAPTTPNVEMVTLDQLAREMKMSPRDARMVLRFAAKQTKQYPTLGKEHIARQPWSWTPGSKTLDEARKALTTAQTDA